MQIRAPRIQDLRYFRGNRGLEEGPRSLGHHPGFATKLPILIAELQDLDLRAAGWASCGVVAAFALAFGSGLETEPLLADGATPYDSDHDGLPDSQELLLGTSPHLADSDFDGFGDAEEVVLGSSPFDITSVPALDSEVSTSVTVRGEIDGLHVLFVLYAADGNLDDKTLSLALYTQDRYGVIPIERLLPFAEIAEVEVSEGGKIMTMDVTLPTYSVPATGSLTWVARAGTIGGSEIAAAKADLSCSDGVILWRREGHLLPPSVNFAATFGGGGAAATGSIHEPIPPGGDAVPGTWEPGQVCIQQSATVGSDGPLLIQEVISAECQTGWNSYCDANCAGSVGSLFTTVDTMALLGG